MLFSNAYRPRRRSQLETRALTNLNTYDTVRGHSKFRINRLVEDNYNLDWKTDPVFPDAQTHNIPLKIIPAFTVDNIKVQWTNTAANDGTPSYKIIFLMTADNGVSADAVEQSRVRKVTVSNTAQAADPSSLALNILIEAMFRWSVCAMGLGQQDDITCGQLENLYQQMNMPQTEENFNISTLSDFFDNNLVFNISSIPQGDDPAEIGGIVFPMIPTLQWSSTELGTMDYDRYNLVGPAYEAGADKYFNAMVVNRNSQSSASDTATNDTATFSMANYIFCDYFLMIARTSVQSALDVLTKYSYQLCSGDSLKTIADNTKFKKAQVSYIIKAGDTAASLALLFGLTTSELIYLNSGIESQLESSQPGTGITVNIGITPQSVAINNQNAELTENLSLDIGTVSYQLSSGEAIMAIADRFGITDVMDLFNPLPEGVTGMSADSTLLRTGSVLAIKNYTYSNPALISVDLASAVFFTRLDGSSSVIYQPWYTENIFNLNQDKLKACPNVLPAGIELSIPSALYNTGNTVLYTTLAGDTIEWIGAYFSLLQNFNADLDPDGDFGKFNMTIRTLNPNGSGPVIMPDTLQHSLEPLETLDSVWKRFFMDNLSVLADMIKEQQGILAPLAVVNIPGVVYKTKSSDTLATVAAALNISVEELSDSTGVITTADIFLSSSESPVYLEIQDIPKMNISDILEVLQNSKIHSQISGMLSRFFLHGLRLPAPEQNPDGSITATGPMTGLYELTGQQVNGIAPDSSKDPEDIRTVVSFTEKIQKNWVEFYDSYTINSEDTIENLEAKHTQLRRNNPAIHMEGRLNPGLIILTGQIPKDGETGLQINIKEKHLRDGYPSETLQPEIVAPLSAMKLSETTPKSYSLQQNILWQTPVLIELPEQDSNTQLTGTPYIWLFSQDLTSRVQSTGGSLAPFSLKYYQGTFKDTPVEFEQYSWATLLKINIRKCQGKNGNGYLKNTYEVIGLDEVGRILLYQLIQVLPQQDNPADRVFLLYDTGASSTIPSGLSADNIDIGNTCIIKTNLTTETASGANNFAAFFTTEAAPSEGDFYAALKCHRKFLTLLWECSVVGGGGFYLRYAAETGESLPDSVFSSDGSGSVWLSVLLSSQSLGSAPDRKLYPFNNCAVTGINLDTSSVNLFAEVADGSETVSLPTVQPGNVGFDMTLRNPEITPPADAAQLTAQRLYSLLGYKIYGQGGGFVTSPEATPVSPTEIGDPTEPLAIRNARRLARMQGSSDEPATENWQLHQVIPISRFADNYILPDCSPLPKPSDDPYAGIAVNAKAPVSVWFTDIFGNVSDGYATQVDLSKPADGDLCLPVGYMDEVIGVGKWPGVINTYDVSSLSNGQGALLNIYTAFQPSSFMPDMVQSFSGKQSMIAKQLERYTRIYYQIHQQDITFDIRTSLSQASGQESDVLAFDGTKLRSFASSACIWLTGISSLVQAFADTSVSDTFNKISAYYGVSYAELALYNLSGQVNELFSCSAISAPAYIIFAQGDSFKSLSDKLSIQGITRRPADLMLEAENVILPLKTGAVLAKPVCSVTLTESGESLTDIAARYKCTSGGFASVNAGLQGLLTIGSELSYQGLTLTVQATVSNISQSFNDLAERFITEEGTDSRTTGIDIAMSNQNTAGIFQTNVSVQICDYIVSYGETLLSNGSDAAKEDLASLNTDTKDIYYAGTSVYYSEVNYPAEGSVDEFCRIYNITPEQLFCHNRNIELTSGCIMLPGAVTFPSQTASVCVPYQPNLQDSLETIVNKFDIDGNVEAKPLNLAQMNFNIPGIFTSGETITVNQVSVVTEAGESFSSLLDKFKEQAPQTGLGDIVTSIENTVGLFNPELFFICPPALTPQNNALLSLDELSQLYNIPVLPLASANCSLLGIIQSGIELSVIVDSEEGGQQTHITYSVTTTDSDTLNSIVSRFNDQTPASLEDVILANQSIALIKPNSRILLPPNTALTSATIGATGPKYPSAIFPLTVALEIKRSQELIHPDFSVSGPECYDQSNIPPYTTRNQNENDSLKLRGFAEAFQKVIPSLWLATCKAKTFLEGNASQAASSGQDLWAVFFGEGGISKVNIKKGVNYPEASANYLPRYFALRPLSNKLASQQGVSICPLNDHGTLGEASLLNYQGIDLEVWARKFLTDVELFLSASNASGVWNLNNGEQRDSLDSIISSKKILCEAIPKGIDYVLDTSAEGQNDAVPDPAKQSAQNQLEQQLRFNLSRAYSTDIILQFDSDVLSQGLDKPARLCGHARAVNAPSSNSVINTKFSITNAKTPLDTGSSYVNFLLDVNNEQLQQSITLNLDYEFNELEFNIQKSDDIDGYEASNWLSFILPIGETAVPDCISIDLGQSVIPLPLRIYPENPQLISQLAIPCKASPVSIQEAELWNYIFSYAHQDASQDTLNLTVQLNNAIEDINSLLLMNSVPTLLETLAQYMSVSDKLWDILSRIAVQSGTITDETLGNAIETFASIVRNVAASWNAHWSGTSALFNMNYISAIQKYDYTVKLNSDANAAYYSSLTLVGYNQDSPWLTAQVPSITCIPEDLTEISLTAGPPSGNTCVYSFPEGSEVPVFARLTFRFEFVGLNIINRQNALSLASVLRNNNLYSNNSITIPTNPDFIFQTAQIGFANITTPFISCDTQLPFGASGDLADAIGNLFSTILGTALDIELSVSVQYGYTLVQASEGEKPIIMHMPVIFKPRFVYSDDVPDELANALTDWQNAKNLDKNNQDGFWNFSVNVFSTVPGASQLPLLGLKELTTGIRIEP
jgi:LysM repeat protein